MGREPGRGSLDTTGARPRSWLRSRAKSWAQNLSLLLLGSVLALVLLESSLRLFRNPFGFRVRGDRIVLPVHRRYEIHNTRIPKLDGVIVHTKNSLGFRGPEPPERFRDHLTLLTVGGSTTECFYLGDGDTWTDRLGHRLGENFENTWINNAGLDGTSTFGHIVLMQDHVSRLRPKVAVFLVGLNDQGRDDLRREDRVILRSPSGGADRIEDWALGRSESVALVLNLKRYLQTRNREVDDHTSIDVRDLPARTVAESDIERLKQRHRSQHLDLYRERLERLVEVTRAGGTEPVLVTQPVVHGSGIDPSTGVDLGLMAVGKWNGRTQWEVLELYNGVTRAVGATNGVLVVDLASKLEKDSRYFYDFTHYTKEGARRVADVIYGDLCGWLEARFPEFVARPCREHGSSGPPTP